MARFICIIFCQFFVLSNLYSKDFIIYSIEHAVPMGYENEKVNKNYYLNLGKLQGIRNGSIVNVLRRKTTKNQFHNYEQIEMDIKLGTLRIIHSEDYASIGVEDSKSEQNKKEFAGHKGFMIGDIVTVPTE